MATARAEGDNTDFLMRAGFFVTKMALLIAVADIAAPHVIDAVHHSTEGGDFDETNELARGDGMILDIIFGDDPDPNDDDGFRKIIFRFATYVSGGAAALAVKLGVQPSTISRWKNGQNLPRPYGRSQIVHTILSFFD